MKLLPLVWAGLWRRPVRTIFTVLSIAIAFLLVGLLQGVNAGFDEVIAAARRDLMTTDARVRGSPPMPIAMMGKIASVPGVAEVVPRAYFTGVHQPPNDLAAIATIPDRFFALRPALAATPEGLAAMQRTRAGMLITPALLRRNGWKVGDRITLRSRELKVDGSGDWTFELVGTFDSIENANTAMLGVINYAYFDEYRAMNRGTAERYYLRIDDPNRSIATAAAIDDMFANSSHATRTRSDQARAEADTRQMGDLAFFTNSIVGAVLFTLMFLTGNTMRQSIHERIPEFGVLKAVGFADTKVLGLAFAEGLMIFMVGAALGLALAAAVAPFITEINSTISVSSSVFARAGLLAVLFALLSVALPGWRLYRMPVVDSLAAR